MYLVFTRMPGESHSRRSRSSLLCSCDVAGAVINSLSLLQLLLVNTEKMLPSPNCRKYFILLHFTAALHIHVLQ